MPTPSIGTFSKTLFTAILAAASFAPASQAQNVRMLAQADVPFAFEAASGQHFAAGHYFVSLENLHTVVVQGDNKFGYAMSIVDNDRDMAKTSAITFRRYGDQYFLSDISIAGDARHLHFLPSKAETRLQIAGNRTTPQGVQLALAAPSR